MILLLLIASFACGIVSSIYLSLGTFYALLLLLMGVVFISLFYLRRSSLFLICAGLCVAASFGVGRVLLVPDTLPESFRPLVETHTTIEGVVVSDPDIREESQRLTLDVTHNKSTTHILVVAPLYPEVHYGETIRATGTLTYPEPFETDTGRIFRYDTFLQKDGVFVMMQRADIDVIAPRSGMVSHLRGALSDLKFSGIEALGVALPEPHASLASGLIVGGKQGLGDTLLEDFIRTGLIHIVVLSGYNVMIVAEFVVRMFGFVSRRYATIAAALTIAAFVLAAGAGAASIRAGIMAGIALYGRATGRTYDAFRALMLAGVLMVLWNPLTLVYDPGFQLSFIATLGLLFGAPRIESYLGWIRVKMLRELVAATLAAQLFVLPLLLYQNGLFSLVALPANLLVLPLVPMAMLASFVALIAGALVPFLAPLIALPAYLFLTYIIELARGMSHLPLATFSVPAFPFIFVILSYALLAAFVIRTPQQNVSQSPTT